MPTQSLSHEIKSERYQPVEINLENKNGSQSLTVELVGENKRVLEIGTSTGCVTKVLMERGNQVIGVEIDKDAGEAARQYCESMIIGDVDELDLDAYIDPASIDVILMADVLEHLRWPARLLGKIKNYLKQDGYLVVSIPNVAHGDLLFNILNGDSRYTLMGLLDETHLKFFGRRNIINIFNNLGYTIGILLDAKIPVGPRMDSNKIPHELMKHISSLPDSDVYQFVFKAIPSDNFYNEAIPELDFNKSVNISLDDILEQHESEKVSVSLQLKRANDLAAVLGRNISQLQKEIEDRDSQITTISSQLQQAKTEWEDQIASLSNQLQEANIQVQALRQTNAECEAENASIISKLKVEKSQALTLRQTNAEHEAQITAFSRQLQMSNAYASSLEHEIAEMKQSVIWNVTMRFHNSIVERALPMKTRRREWYNMGLKSARTFVNDCPKVMGCCESEVPGKEIISGDFVYEQYINDLLDRTVKKSVEYVPLSKNYISLKDDDIKLIAFYLPQYHPIPENDEWWGKGFTDWTNVSKAVPQFTGHYQPHLPDELGFYDLRLIEIQKRQVELAKQYGIYGFCFHYYWFNGRRLLEKPLDQFANSTELDFPFCICWANENWTRRWDGMENEVLISQTHSPENDLAFISDLRQFFKNPRYIRINNRPVLIVYRASLLPDAKTTVTRWRAYCKEQGIGDPYLIAAQTFGFNDPRAFGFDAAVEFPPHTMPGCNYLDDKINVINPEFKGKIWDYDKFVKSKHYQEKVPFKLFKSAMPGWDNTARRPNDASIFHGSNPENYKEWLWNIAEWTAEVHQPQERLIFINAMNEWAEGAHLEPDRKYGYGYLKSTREIIQRYREKFGKTDIITKI